MIGCLQQIFLLTLKLLALKIMHNEGYFNLALKLNFKENGLRENVR